MIYLALKRSLDVVSAAMGLLLLMPLFTIVALLIKITMQGPIFFTQERPGRNGKIFRMVKFRSMSLDESLPENERITWLGSLIRKTSIDELPELYNVLKGDMSLVGPRPLLVEYLPLYSATQLKRHDVKPGITGWAQVNGRNSLDWETRFNLDVWYVENAGLWLDLKILFLTFKSVVMREGINQSKEITMTKFRGTSQKDVA